MREGIKQEVCGHLQPFIIDKNTIAGNIQTLVDWNLISNYHKPTGAVNYVFKGQLEYLQCDYYISSLNSITSANLPNVNELRDSNLQKQSKYYDFKRKYNASTGHAIELMLHTEWANGDWGMPKASEYLYNLGQYGYINLFDPYLLRDSEILYSDTRYKVGCSIDGSLGDFDHVEINGGYSGIISYFEEEDPTNPLSESSGDVNVGTQAIQILPSRSNRKIILISNDSDKRLYFRFANSQNSVSINSPFLEPGESLSLDHSRADYSGGNQHQWIMSVARNYIPLRCYGIRESGSGNVFYQEFY
ncbi:MAG: hypothetical protein AAGJ08_01840 [Cyanobacteria bacterium P01_H01_bin.35]